MPPNLFLGQSHAEKCRSINSMGYKRPQKKEEMRHPLAFLAEGKSYLSFGVDLSIFCTSTESWDLWVGQEELLSCRPNHPFCHSRECLEGTSDKGGLSKKSPFQWGLNTSHTRTQSACHWITSPEICPILFLRGRIPVHNQDITSI